MLQLTLPELFEKNLADCADRTAIRYNDESLSFADFDRQSRRVAGFLQQLGIQKGDRVGLCCINSDAFALAYYGIIRCGAAVVTINTLLNPKEVAYILNDAGARALFYFDGFAEGVSTLDGNCPQLEHYFCMGQHRANDQDTFWSDILSSDNPLTPPALNAANDTAAILYTSGTTGQPKGAMLSHRNLVSNIDAARQAMLLAPDDVILVVLPMFHAFAATLGMLMPLHFGCRFVPLSKFDPQLVANTLALEKITVLPAVPSMYNLLLRLPEAFTVKFDSLRFCISGAAAMPQAVMEQFEQRFGKLIYEGDGPTECSPVTSVNPVGGKRKLGSVGPPVPGVEMKIMDDQGQELPIGDTGEICVRGPNVMQGYWNRPEETRESFFGDWFRTGDLGHTDEDGYFFIVDRKKDLIIVNGMNVYPRVIEEALYKHPPIAEAAVVGEPHELHGEIPVAYVALKPDETADANSIRKYCQTCLGRHEVPRKVFFMDQLPKNAAGKILKRELRKHGELERGVDSREKGGA